MSNATRRADLRTTVRTPETVAAALRPDNTEEMHTRVAGDAIETTIERPTTGGLHTTVDDYACNLSVATAVVEIADDHATDATGGDTDISERASTDEHLHTDDTDTP